MSASIRRILSYAIGAALLVGFYFFGRTYLWPAPDTDTIHAVGVIEAPEVNITSRIAGRIAELNLVEGDSVRKGQVVCKIEDVDLRNQLRQAEANVEKAEVGVADAERTYARDNALLKRGVIAIKDFDDASTRLGQARAELISAKASAQFYRDQLADTRIVAPIDGVIVNKALEVGEWVTPGTPMLTVDDLSTIWARVDVQETELGHVHVGQPAQVTLQGQPPMTFSGRVMAIGQEGEFATERDVQRGRQDIRTFYVKVRVLQADGSLKPGMTAQVALARRDGIFRRGDSF